MISLTPMQVEHELSDLNSRLLIKTYSDAETDRLDQAVYSKLERQHPSLAPYLRLVRQKPDPVQVLAETAQDAAFLKKMATLVKESPTLANSNCTHVRGALDLINRVEPFAREVQQSIDILKAFYAGIAKGIKRSAVNNGISAYDAVRQTQELSSIIRFVFPTKAEAQASVQIQISRAQKQFSMIKEVYKFADRTGLRDAKLDQIMSQLPDERATAALCNATFMYKMRELDSFY